MSSALLILAAIIVLGLGYHFYGRLIEQRVVEPEQDRQTPAFALRDGVDYEPARPVVLFGHHFSSIAGAGPIIGPVLGIALFGWAAVLGWIVLGTLFIGGVHDYLSLMMSSRRQGRSVADISDEVISPRAGVVFSIFLWLALVLVIAVFAVVGSKALMTPGIGPQMVFPTFMLIVIAMLFGITIRRGWLPLWLSTLLAVGLMGLAIYAGYAYIHLSLDALFPGNEVLQTNLWFITLMIYCLIASVLPVWLLLQPRDYISVFKLFLGLLLGCTGIMLAHPQMHAPAYSGLRSSSGPLWPMLFVIVACGAISGFHSVVASGTSAKQLPAERFGRRIGYGAMVLEAFLAVMVLCLVGAGLYWSKAYAGNALYAPDILKSGGGPLAVFAKGFGNVVGAQAFPWIGMGLASLLGMIVLKTFVLTTLDTCTRLARFVVTEQLGEVSWVFRSRFVATIVTVVPAFIIGYSGAWQKVWPVFGAANQLIAALTLLVLTCYLLGIRKPSAYTSIPAAFMLLTTIGALVYQAYGFFTHTTETGVWQPQWLLGGLSVVLVALAIYVGIEALARIRRLVREGDTRAYTAIEE